MNYEIARLHRFLAAGVAGLMLATAGTGLAYASGEHAAAEAEITHGAHGGRLLEDGSFAVEITIHEAGVPPRLRVYCYENGKPLDPAEVMLRIELHRFGGRVDEIGFRARRDHLLGDREVEEPHSFDVVVEARYAGATYRWHYESHEGRVEIAPEAAAASGIVIESAVPAILRERIRLPGRIVPNGDRLSRIGARYPGVILEMRMRPGDQVARGGVVAVVESNESMRPYEVRSPIAGTVLERSGSPGEVTDGSSALYVVADLATVWLDLAARPEEAMRLRPGQTVRVDGSDGDTQENQIVFVSATGSERTQTVVARAELANAAGSLRPGLFVTAEVLVDEVAVPVAVRNDALQTLRDGTVVFLTDGRVYQAMPVETGLRDDEWTEVRSGISAGQRYVARGSFVVKADVGKSGATHEH